MVWGLERRPAGRGQPRARSSAYLWIEVLGRSARQLAAALGVCPELVYRAAKRGRGAAGRWRHVLGVPQSYIRRNVPFDLQIVTRIEQRAWHTT